MSMKDTVQEFSVPMVGLEFDCTWAAEPYIICNTGIQILSDIIDCINTMQDHKLWGPYWIYTDRKNGDVLQNDFKTNTCDTVRQRLMAIDLIHKIKIQPSIPTGKLRIVDASEWGIAEVVNLSGRFAIQ
jgi:hypothetical protein